MKRAFDLAGKVAGWVVAAVALAPHLPCFIFIVLVEQPWKETQK